MRLKATHEARATFRDAPIEGSFDTSKLPYINACVKETLRLKVANITHRKTVRDIDVTTSDGRQYRLAKGETLTAASYLQHYNPQVFPEPHLFRPERWFEKEYEETDWFPFGAGTNMCSGRHLAQMEMALLLAIFLREFDTELIDPIPDENWENTVAMVSPQERSCRFRYTRVAR